VRVCGQTVLFLNFEKVNLGGFSLDNGPLIWAVEVRQIVDRTGKLKCKDKSRKGGNKINIFYDFPQRSYYGKPDL